MSDDILALGVLLAGVAAFALSLAPHFKIALLTFDRIIGG